MAAGILAAEKIDRDKILSHDNEWKKVYDDFTIDGNLIDSLKAKIGDNLKIDVYLGLWCGDSRENVPPFIKIIDKINESGKITANYYTVERKPNSETQYYVEEMKVERVPTFIFYKDGEEIGRIIENPSTSMAEDFLEIII
jgi:thiol-disulfide isomerase/thioredoxin